MRRKVAWDGIAFVLSNNFLPTISARQMLNHPEGTVLIWSCGLFGFAANITFALPPDENYPSPIGLICLGFENLILTLPKIMVRVGLGGWSFAQ